MQINIHSKKAFINNFDRQSSPVGGILECFCNHSGKNFSELAIFAAAVFLIVTGAATGKAQSLAKNEREVTVLHMADTHAALEAHPEIFFDREGKPYFRQAGGFALLAAAIKAERAKAAGGAGIPSPP